jgi:DNA methyltransferase 1-associated protein 1
MSAIVPPAPPPLPASHHPSRAMKLGGMRKDVMTLVSGEQNDSSTTLLPPMVPNLVVKVGSKYITSEKKCRKWKWDSFQSSARHDQQEFRHWVRAGVEYPDYPYARFDIHLERVQFTNEEYRKHLTDPMWTKSDTDQLMDLARIHELRWAVIYDRWCGSVSDYDNPSSATADAVVDDPTPSSRKNNSTQGHRRLEDLQHRFYTVAATLAQVRITKEAAAEVSALSSVPNADTSELLILETAAARALATSGASTNNNASTADQSSAVHNPPILLQHVGTGTSSNKQVFQLQHERERRRYLDKIWHRTKAEEEEELELRKELKLIDLQLRKLKKSGGHLAAAAANNNRAVSPVPVTAEQTAALLDTAFGSTAPIPMPETPYLQSGRLAAPASGGPLGINKTVLKRMETVLVEECKVPAKPLVPTKRFCDLYDAVRKDTLTLLTLQKVVLQKEGQLQTKRLRLAKVSGRAVMEEEALLGIAPTPMPAPAPAARANKKQQKRSSGTGSKVGGGGGSGKVGASAAGSAASKAASAATTKGDDKPTGTAKKAATKKRKSKADTNKAAAAVAAVGDTPAPVSVPPIPTTAAASKIAATAAAAAAASAAAGGDDKTPSKKRARKSQV